MKNLSSTRIKNGLNDFFAHFGLLFVIFIPLFALINFTYIYISYKTEETLKTQQTIESNEQISIIDFVIRTNITNTYNDLLVIRDSDELSLYVNDSNPATLSDTEQLLLRIASNKETFNDISYVDLTGQEIIRVENTNSGPVLLASEDLTNISDITYFQNAFSLTQNQFYISNISVLEIDDNSVPIISFVVPVYNNSNVKQGFIVINYIATNIMSVFNEYYENAHSHIILGLLSNDVLYQFDADSISNEYTISIVSDFDSIYNTDNNDNSIVLHSVAIDSDLEDLYQADEDFLQIFAYLDYESLLEQRGSILGNNYYILVLIDVFVILIFAYIGIVLKSRNDDRVLLNANVYLSDTNKDGVLLTNANKEVTYINKTFTSIFGYTSKDIKGLTPRQFLRTQIRNEFDIYQNPDSLFKKVLWNISKSKLYILSYLRINTIKSLKGNIKYFIAIYSYPAFNSKTILAKIPKDNKAESFSDIIKKISEIFYIRQLKVNSSMMFLVKIEFVTNTFFKTSSYQFDCDICEYLKSNLDEKYIIAIPTRDYILVSIKGNLNRNNISYYHNHLVSLIDSYKYDHSQEGTLSYVITSDYIKESSDTYEGMIFNVFAAMEFSKKAITRKYLPYQDNMRSILRRDNKIREQLDNGFEKDEFYLNYQVQSSLKNDSITGVEALLRWKNEKLGIIPPGDFIPIIEDSYHINSLSIMVIKKVIKDFEPYYKELPENFKISINLTSFDFHNESIIKEIINIINSSLISTNYFCFEITESGYLENTDKTNKIIDYLHSKGIIIAIDDFGKGFSSLSSLKDIHADIVKVDRAFIKDYPENDDGLLHKTIANLINTLGLKIVIEGTETIEQIDLAKSTNCHQHQGYYVSKPLNFDDFFNLFIKKNKTV